MLIVDNGTVVAECVAVNYLERYYPDAGDGQMMPDAAGDKTAQLRVLGRFYESEDYKSGNVHYVFDDEEPLLDKKSDEHARDRAEEASDKTLQELAFWETHLGSGALVAGNEWTMADVSVLSVAGLHGAPRLHVQARGQGRA